MPKYSVVVRVEYEIELDAEDAESAEEEARRLFDRGSIRRFSSGEVESVQADEIGQP